jgi:carbonic anhydrase
MQATSTAALASHPATITLEKPQNGLKGLKHFQHDILAGLVVSLISLPFSLGIAVASGAPPITGITSAIIAGFVLPFLGGSYVTVSGPAAGLAPILLASMMVLGRGDLATGYPLLLVAICLAGCVQLVLARLKFARLCAMFPAAVVEGMLCSIGLLIIVKQFPFMMGVKFHAHEFYEYVLEVPSHIAEANPTVFLIGAASLALMFGLSACKANWLKVVPPQVIAVVFGSVLGLIFGLSGTQLINIPENPLAHGFQWPHFQGVWNDMTLWPAIVTTVVTLTLIDGIESLATVMAIDKIDPFHRKSNPDRTLSAMGVSNLVSSLAGGLTIIPGGVKSTACIMSGGRTQWANFYNACFLLVYLLLARPIINLMPYGVLAAMLIFTGYKLCRPKVWKHVAHIGWEQLAIFTITVVATLSTDLLWGILTGIGAKLLFTMWVHLTTPQPAVAVNSNGHGIAQPGWLARMAQAFRSPVARSESIDDEHHVFFGGPLVSFNLMHVSHELSQAATKSKKIYLHVTDQVTVVDHTSCENLMHFAEECHRNGTAHVELLGLDAMAPRSEFPSCMRTRAAHRRGGGRQRTDESARASVASHDFARDDHGSHDPASAGIVTCSASPRADAEGDNAMTWLSLSTPPAAPSASDVCDRDTAARACAEMDWIDLKVASGEPHGSQTRRAQAASDMDWLSLRQAIGSPLTALNHWFAR